MDEDSDARHEDDPHAREEASADDRERPGRRAERDHHADAHEEAHREDAYERARRRAATRRRWRAGGAIGAIVAVLLLIVVTLAPPWMIGRATQAHMECVNGFVERGGGDPEACGAAARRWLVLPRALPWHREAAAATDNAIAYDIAELRLARATTHTPDAGRRDAAAAEMVAIASRPLPPASFDALALELHAAGALGTLVEASPRLQDAGARRVALRDAILLGRFEDADAIARAGDPRDWEQELARGAWLCLRGHLAEGRAALASADGAYQRRVRDAPWGAARMALLACDPEDADPAMFEVSDIDGTAMLSALMHFRPEEVDVAARLALHLVNESAIDEAYRSPFVAHVVSREEHALPDLIAVVDPVTLALPRLGLRLLPFSGRLPATGPFSPTPLLLDPVAHASAAAELAAAAEAAPLPPLDASPDEPLWERQRRERLDRARKDPGPHLRAAAWTLFLEAAMTFLDRGDQQGARRALAAAAPLAPNPDDAALLAAPLHLAAGEPEVARDLLVAGLDEPDDAFSTTLMNTNHALALAAQGDRAGAFGAAEAARRAAQDLDRSSAARNQLLATTDWLVAAMALQSDQRDAFPPIVAPSRQGLVTWGDLVIASEAERASHRWRMPALTPTAEILPVVVYVVGAVAEPEGRESWLGRIVPPTLTGPLRSYALARALAAEWRGDAPAAETWRGRHRSMVAFIREPRTDLLARLAGI